MKFPKEFEIRFTDLGCGLPAIRIFPEDLSAEIINVDAAMEIVIDDLSGVYPASVRGYNCLGKSKKLRDSQYELVGEKLRNQ